MVIFVLSFTVINIALWVILLIRFKKLFSTDSIVEKTRAQMNQMVADIDNTTDRDMFLVKESEKRIKQELAEADKKMELFKEATDRLRDMIAEADRINKISNKSKSLYQDFSKTSFGGANTASANITTAKVGNVEKKAATSYTREKNRKFEAQIDPEASFELNPQDDLFSSVEEQHPIIKNETTVTQDGAAYREVPLIITKVYDETAPQNQVQNQVPSHKSLSEQVKQLFEQGYKAEEIAAQLSCSVTEAQFIIDMI
ncbi:MAG: hypothetical protein K6A43_05385 [Treponema sp.]|nr:hypothetical protein [Treponema sp.]